MSMQKRKATKTKAKNNFCFPNNKKSCPIIDRQILEKRKHPKNGCFFVVLCGGDAVNFAGDVFIRVRKPANEVYIGDFDRMN